MSEGLTLQLRQPELPRPLEGDEVKDIISDAKAARRG